MLLKSSINLGRIHLYRSNYSPTQGAANAFDDNEGENWVKRLCFIRHYNCYSHYLQNSAFSMIFLSFLSFSSPNVLIHSRKVTGKSRRK